MSAVRWRAVATCKGGDAITRYTVQTGQGIYHIYYEPKPVPPSLGVDWSWHHDDYDGAPHHADEASRDKRCGTAASAQACLNDILEMEDGE